MKKTTILLSFVLFFHILSFAQTHIPDKNFASAIRKVCSTCIDANDNLTTAATNLSELDLYQSNINSLEGIIGFTNLSKLSCSFNNLTQIPELPLTLTLLNCSFNQIISLPNLPQGLNTLNCYDNKLKTLPTLPQSLTSLYCGANQLTALPSLPQNLQNLVCAENPLTLPPTLPQSLITFICNSNQSKILPNLPPNLITLHCSNMQLSTLPQLPQTLRELECDNNQLTALPQLPQSLGRLICSNNQLAVLPLLPQSLSCLYCSHNQLTALPQLPNLTWLICDDNQLTTIPPLTECTNLTWFFCNDNEIRTIPSLASCGSLKWFYCNDNQLIIVPEISQCQSLTWFYCQNNKNLSCFSGKLPENLIFTNFEGTDIKCLPNRPSSLHFTTLPLCDAKSGACSAYPEIRGNVFLDFNNDGIKNNDDVFCSSVLVEAKTYNLDYTNNKGEFTLIGDTSKTIIIALKDISSKFDIKPTERSIKTTAVFSQTFNNQDFRLVPKEVFGDLEVSIVSSVQRPGFNGKLTLTYRNIGTTILSGQIKLEKDPILTYISANPKESSINGHTIVWDYVGLQPFESRVITVNVNVPATTPINTKLTNKMSASFNLAGNYYETLKVAEITTVVGSYDPNDKTADIKKLDPKDITNKKPITYTIRFQNTGSFYAERVEIHDTISPLFDLSTFKNIAVSHPNCSVVFENVRLKTGSATLVRWVFKDIFLPDSSTNEAASHGFVRFSIQAKQGLPISTVLANKAYIYFDYNDYIVTNTSVVKVEKTSKVKQNEVEIPLKVYPNPSSDRLFVEIPTDIKGKLFLSNLLGQVVDYQPFTQNGLTVFNMYNLPKGVYILTLTTEEGNVSRKVVKE
jgi:Leucine-rich repeat (LRR) protein